MRKHRDQLLFGLGLLLALGGPSAASLQKERLLRAGRPVLLELAPRDPRSLMQGDYMDLDYVLSRKLQEQGSLPRTGRAVLCDDPRGVAVLVRVHGDEPLSAGEFLVRFRSRGLRPRIGAESYFFQEGQADRFQPARFGELRVAEDGTALLVDLRDKDFRSLGRR